VSFFTPKTLKSICYEVSVNCGSHNLVKTLFFFCMMLWQCSICCDLMCACLFVCVFVIKTAKFNHYHSHTITFFESSPRFMPSASSKSSTSDLPYFARVRSLLCVSLSVSSGLYLSGWGVRGIEPPCTQQLTPLDIVKKWFGGSILTPLITHPHVPIWLLCHSLCKMFN